MEITPSKTPSDCSRATSRSSYSSLSSFADETPKKRKKIDRMVYSIDKVSFEWSQPESKSLNRELSPSSSRRANFEDYLSDNLSDDSESFSSFLGRSLKRKK
jgi:hypothetical protein